jgi:hypothetical protein
MIGNLMPFTPNHLTIEEVEALYLKALCEIEEREVRGWINRVTDPAACPELAAITRARESLEDDLARSRQQWARGKPEGE